MTRTEFSKKTRGQAWARCGGNCEICGGKLFPGKFAFDHKIADGLGGEPTLDNCQVICAACHYSKTVREDRPLMQKADNIRAKHLGLKPKRPWSNFRKKMDGSVVPR